MDGNAPGWYKDPFGHKSYRWWDGRKWSPYARDVEVEWDPIDVRPVRSQDPTLPTMGVAYLGFAFAVAFSFAVLLVLRVAGAPGGLSAELVLSEVALWLPLLGATWYVVRRRYEGLWATTLGFRWRPLDVGLGLAGSIAARSTSAVILLPVIIFQPRFRIPDASEFQRFTHGIVGWIALTVVTCIGAPFVEEIFFRGLIQTRLVARFGTVPGIAATSILFGAAHLIGWEGTISLVYALGIVGAGVT